MLGSYLVGPRVVGLSHPELDVRHPDRVERLLRQAKPSVVIHAAALTDLEFCEIHPRLAFETNVIGTACVARACRDLNTRLVVISSAGIFGDQPQDIFSEDDKPLPINIYHRTKWQAEHAALKYCPQALVLRLGWLMGGRERDHKFVGRTVRAFQRTLASPAAREFPMAADNRGSLLYAPDLAAPLWTLLRSGARGVFHVANAGTGSRYDIAQAIKNYLAPNDKRIAITSAQSRQFTSRVARPRSEMLNCRKIETYGIAMRPWHEALHDYLRDWVAA